MIRSETIFQRTQQGRDEIYHKSHGVTQSERRVLIMVDGVASYGDLSCKMSSLTAARIERALSTLLQRDLIYEVLMPLPGQQAEQLDVAVVNKFLQQDALDPATIISLDPEEDFGELEEMFRLALPEIKEAISRRRPMREAVSGSFQEPPKQSIIVPEVVEPLATAAAEAADIPLAESLTVSVDWQAVPEKTSLSHAMPLLSINAASEELHWGYWVISAGLCVMGGSLLTRIFI